MEIAAIKLWNVMGGEICLPALPWLATWIGCDDIDGLLEMLMTIREAKTPRGDY